MLEVAERTFRLESGGVGPFLIEADGFVLVDTGLPRRGADLLAELGDRVTGLAAIVLTHAHPDHIGNVEVLRRASGAPVVAGFGERPLLEGDWSGAGLAARLVRRVIRAPLEVSVDRWVSDGDTVAGVEIVATPGHTPGHIALVLGAVMVCGDAFVGGETPRESPRLFTMDREESRRSVERLADRRWEVALSAHGRSMSDPVALDLLVQSWSRQPT